MKRNTALRTMAASLGAVCLLSAVSCSLPGQNGGGDGSSKGEKPKQTASDVIKHSYAATSIGSQPDATYVNSMTRLGDTDNVLVVGSDNEGSSHMFLTDTNFESYNEIKPDYNKGDNADLYCNITAALDGTIFDIATITDYGDYERPDWKDPNFDYDSFDWDAYQEAAETSYFLYTFDSTGKELNHAEINMDRFMDGAEDDMVTPYLGSLTPIDSEHALIQIGGEKESYYILNADGTFGNEVNFPDDVWLYAFCATTDGNIAFSTWADDHACIGTINTDTLKVNTKDIVLKDMDNESLTTLVTGDGDYDFYASTYSGLYGIKADGSCDELTSWVDSDLSGDNVRSMMSLGNNEFIIYVYDYSDQSASGFYRISERDASELADKTLITLAVIYSDTGIMNEVNSFNRSSDEYRIKVTDYSKYYDWDESSETYLNTPAKQFKLDIIAGNSPDMIYFDSSSAIKGLSNKGTFVDLYDYLGKDGSVSKDEIVPSLLSACEENGKLYSISPTFSLSTAAVKAKYSDKENWTVDDLIEAYNKLPEGAKLTMWDNSKSGAFSLLTQNMNFVDFNKGTCNYDTDEFVKILEFCNQFPDEEEEPDWEHMTDDEYQKYYDDQQNAVRKDKALLSTIDFYDLRSYMQEKTVTFGEDITLVGYPSTDGCGMMVNQSGGAFSILSDSPNKDECWKFISKFFTEDYQSQTGNKYIWGIPALKSVLDQKLEECKEDPYWTDENGEKQYYDNETTIGDKTIKIPNLSDADVEFIRDIICNAKTHGMQVWDEDVNNIVNEEIQAYFSGEKTAKQTAEIIQNRVSILVSEQS
ncbi:MAG: extracellular solute-binding protein [Ruminococcus sp.]|nr:extracellular solute-binding protein [Ruminococcus sp.]